MVSVLIRKFFVLSIYVLQCIYAKRIWASRCIYRYFSSDSKNTNPDKKKPFADAEDADFEDLK